jgi:hypothetical protein
MVIHDVWSNRDCVGQWLESLSTDPGNSPGRCALSAIESHSDRIAQERADLGADASPDRVQAAPRAALAIGASDLQVPKTGWNRLRTRSTVDGGAAVVDRRAADPP